MTAFAQCYDETLEAEALPNLNRLLAGRVVTVNRRVQVGHPGGEDHVDEPTTFTIWAVVRTCVGVDVDGIFCGIKVASADRREWTLYADGDAEDPDGNTCCTHDLRGARP